MCGIVAYLGTDISTGERFVRRALGLLRHRGPNDEGIHTATSAVLGHRRLSILDLSAAGHQPMRSPDHRWTLVFNGEIYNHLELRSAHCKPWQFNSHSDTETVLAMLSLHGPQAFERFVGMWALALWDDQEKTLLISRDRYGQKPLYWRHTPHGDLRFCSEIAPLLAERERPACNPLAIAEFLATGNYGHLSERCFFRDILVFPPAHWAIVRQGDARPNPNRYWRLPSVPLRHRRPYDETAKRRFRAAFEEAVESQLLSDVPVGATLSGGLDSSSVVGAIATRRQNVPVFSALCSKSEYDESRFVQAVEQHWPGKLDIHRISVRELRISECLRENVRIQEEPLGDPSMAAHRQLMEAAQAAGVPVILGGQGGDELLFGYPHMLGSAIAASLRIGHVRWALSESRKLNMPFRNFIRAGLSAFLPALETWLRHRSRNDTKRFLATEFQHTDEVCIDLSGWSDFNATQRDAIERFCLPHLTHYDDRSGMRSSVEGRMPFLDHRLAETLSEFEIAAYVGNGYSKRILRESCADLIPDAVLTRRDKIGFYTPVRDMLLNELPFVREALLGNFARELNWYNIDWIDSLLAQLESQPEASATATKLWRILAVRVWAEEFNIGFESLDGELPSDSLSRVASPHVSSLRTCAQE